jgi:hypothetical protein
MIEKLWEEIGLITDSEIHDLTLTVAKAAPEDSWRLPTSRDHHKIDERGEWGNLLHTLRVARICDVFADILNLDSLESNLLKSAAILHDSCKHGVNAEAAFIYKEHPYLVRSLFTKAGIDCRQPTPSYILNCIEQHMGRWGATPFDWADRIECKVNLSFLLHSADCIEARLDRINHIRDTVKKSCSNCGWVKEG